MDSKAKVPIKDLALSEMITNDGESILELSKGRPIMIVFLRHFGCTFCRETLSDLSSIRMKLEERNIGLVFVHMVDQSLASRMMEIYELDDVPMVSDPDLAFYQRFGLQRAPLIKFLDLRMILRTLYAGVINGHMMGKPVGNALQMPGIFLAQDGRVVDSYIHRLICDRPDYLNILPAV